MNVTVVKVHPPEEVEAMLAEAYRMAHETTEDPVQWPHVFNAAVTMLSARVPVVAQPQSVPMLDFTKRQS